MKGWLALFLQRGRKDRASGILPMDPRDQRELELLRQRRADRAADK